MSLIEIELDPRERGRVPPAEEFETVQTWLEALPAGTVLIVTAGVPPYRATKLVLVEDVRVSLEHVADIRIGKPK